MRNLAIIWHSVTVNLRVNLNQNVEEHVSADCTDVKFGNKLGQTERDAFSNFQSL